MPDQRPYRGLTKEGKKWIYGWYIKYTFHGELICVIVDSQYNALPDFMPLARRTTRVVPETVSQNTGLKDKKRTEEFPEGQEIYAGDKVGGWPHGTVIVVWQEDFACFGAVDEEGNDYGLFANQLEDCKDAWEVIGSIHDHLLKGAK